MIKEVNLELFYERIDYYHFTLMGFALAGIVGYLLLSKEQRKNKAINLSLGLLVLIAFYELLGAFVSSQKIVNFWVYNLFNSHLAVTLFFLLIRSFLKRTSHRKTVSILIGLFLFLSLVLHLTQLVHYNEGGEYIDFLNSILMLSCCGLYFFELMTQEEFLDTDPIKEYSFWATTAIMFYSSASFMVYISFRYLYTHHLEIFFMVKTIPRGMTLLCSFLLCFAVYSPLLKERFQLEIVHV
jgi:hypothetical protein